MGIRTPDLLNAIEALYQLSYDPGSFSLNRIGKSPGMLFTPFAGSGISKSGTLLSKGVDSVDAAEATHSGESFTPVIPNLKINFSGIRTAGPGCVRRRCCG